MCIGVRGKLFLVSLGLLVVSVATAEIYLLPSVEHDLTERIRQDLHVRLNLVAERSAAHAQSQRGEIDWDVLADGLGAIAQARVTLIGADGLVVGDSEVSGQALAALENHRERPEVVAAFAGRTANSRPRVVILPGSDRHRDDCVRNPDTEVPSEGATWTGCFRRKARIS